MECIFKIGDKLRCKEGFTTGENSGGSGYIAHKEITVGRISEHGGRHIIWPVLSNSNGIYSEALELVNGDINYEIY